MALAWASVGEAFDDAKKEDNPQDDAIRHVVVRPAGENKKEEVLRMCLGKIVTQAKCNLQCGQPSQ